MQVLVMPKRQLREIYHLSAMEKRKESRIPLNTKRNTAWAVCAWKEWAEEINDKAPVKHDKVREGFDIYNKKEEWGK